MIVPSFSWLSIDTVECSRVFKYRYWKSFRTNDVACGVQESTIQVIDASLGTNECTFCANEQQKVYYKKYPVERHVEFSRKHEAITLKVIDPWQNLKRNSLSNTRVSGKIWISILFLIERVPA